MNASERRISELFHHVREATNILEQMLLENSRSKQDQELTQKDQTTRNGDHLSQPEKLAYTLKEVQRLVGISRSAIYRAFSDRKLGGVKLGGRTLVLAKDLHAWLERLPPR